MKQAAVLNLTTSVPVEPVAPGTIAVAQGIAPQKVIELHVESGLGHIVQSDGYAFEKEFSLAQDMIQNPQGFMDDPLGFIFKKSNSTESIMNFSHRCSAGQNKKLVLSQLLDFLEAIPGTRSIRDDAMMVSDELYTNGAKNCGKLYGVTPENQLSPGWVEFVARADQERLVLGCIDSYGALETTMITKRIQKCFSDGVAQSITQNPAGGAGIGSYMVFNAAVSMYIAVKNGERTIVLCSFPMKMRSKDVMELTKNFHALTVK